MDDARTSARSRSNGPAGVRKVEVLLPLVYDELRRLARRYLESESSYRTLEPTALVHEAYLRLIRLDRIDWHGKTHLFAMAASQMRRILVERARAISARKRGSRPRRITLDFEGEPTPGRRLVDMLALDEAMQRLEARSTRQARVAEMHVFSGMQVDEIAAVLSVSERTVKRDWSVARAWLARELHRGIEP